MFKKVIFAVMYLNLMKPLANGFVIDAIKNDSFNQWLQPFNIASAPLKQWFVNNMYPDQHEASVQLKNTPNISPEKNELFKPQQESIEDTSSPANQPPEPISRVLETLRTEIGKADNEGKKHYTELLTDLEHVFTQKSRYARVFFNRMWHVVDLGLYGSSQRMRDASMVNGMLKPLRDLLNWIYKNAIDLVTWNLQTHDGNYDDGDEEFSTHNNRGMKVTTKVGEKGENNHKIIHKFEIDPFVVKLTMDITCRILDDSKHPNNSPTPTLHKEEKMKVFDKPLDESEDDWDYTDTKRKLQMDTNKAPLPRSGSLKDSKPPVTPPDTGPNPIRPTPGIKPNSIPPSTEKDKPPTPPESPKPIRGSSSLPPTPNGEVKKPKPFPGNPVDKGLLENPPPPGTPLTYSQMKRMTPPSKTPLSDDDDDYDNEDWESGWPGYKPTENNPYMPGYKAPENNPHMPGHKTPETNPRV